MTKEIENLPHQIRLSMARDIEIKMLEREEDGIIVSKEIVLEILKELSEPTE